MQREVIGVGRRTADAWGWGRGPEDTTAHPPSTLAPTRLGAETGRPSLGEPAGSALRQLGRGARPRRQTLPRSDRRRCATDRAPSRSRQALCHLLDDETVPGPLVGTGLRVSRRAGDAPDDRAELIVCRLVHAPGLARAVVVRAGRSELVAQIEGRPAHDILRRHRHLLVGVHRTHTYIVATRRILSPTNRRGHVDYDATGQRACKVLSINRTDQNSRRPTARA